MFLIPNHNLANNNKNKIFHLQSIHQIHKHTSKNIHNIQSNKYVKITIIHFYHLNGYNYHFVKN
jgi:hypothetical protein